MGAVLNCSYVQEETSWLFTRDDIVT